MAGASPPVPLRIWPDAASAARAVAAEIARGIREAAEAGRRYVLGCATGRTMIPVYAELLRLHREEGLSFAVVRLFHLDEYLGLPPEHPASFQRFLREHLVDRVDLEPGRVHFLRGDLDPEGLERQAREYPAAIRAAGGLDLQLLGLGRNGHVAFNEPGSPPDSRLRVVELSPETREANAFAFADGRVPERAVTLGLADLHEARCLRLLAFGKSKREALRALLGGPEDPAWPASLLRGHTGLEVHADPAAVPPGFSPPGRRSPGT